MSEHTYREDPDYVDRYDYSSYYENLTTLSRGNVLVISAALGTLAVVIALGGRGSQFFLDDLLAGAMAAISAATSLYGFWKAASWDRPVALALEMESERKATAKGLVLRTHGPAAS